MYLLVWLLLESNPTLRIEGRKELRYWAFLVLIVWMSSELGKLLNVVLKLTNMQMTNCDAFCKIQLIYDFGVFFMKISYRYTLSCSCGTSVFIFTYVHTLVIGAFLVNCLVYRELSCQWFCILRSKGDNKVDQELFRVGKALKAVYLAEINK